MANSNDLNQISAGSPLPSSGPFLAKVISHQDATYMGVLEVEILRPVGSSSSDGQLHQVKYMSPFLGSTSIDYVGQNNDYNGTQKSYGMWMIPPDAGTTVVIFFIDGDPKRGYWMGCVPDDNMNFMIPGIAASSQIVDGDKRAPAAEYNKKSNDAAPGDPEQLKKPKHPLADVLDKQGLLEDDTRGITTSSARRETPSMVFGISTPGPIDKQANATRGKMGKKESRIDNAFVSRLGGTTFVMDDGDDKFLRKKPASEAPPDYAAAEQGDTDGDRTIPHNELFRIRTRTGHQILLHNSEDLIYIGNAKGTTWIEMTSNGKIDIYAKDSISVHSENDINFTADRDINLTAGRAAVGDKPAIVGNINLNATGNANITATVNTNINSAANLFTATGATNINSGGNITQTGAKIDLNGPTAAKAVKANKTVRVPQVEPWAGHENLNPTASTPDKTRAVLAPAAIPNPEFYKKYTTVTDTFSKIKGA